MGKRRGSSQAPTLTLPLPAPFQKRKEVIRLWINCRYYAGCLRYNVTKIRI